MANEKNKSIKNNLKEELLDDHANNSSFKRNNINDEYVSSKEYVPGNFIVRQEMDSLTPKITLKCALVCNTILILIFTVCGLPNVLAYSELNNIEIDYSNW